MIGDMYLNSKAVLALGLGWLQSSHRWNIQGVKGLWAKAEPE